MKNWFLSLSIALVLVFFPGCTPQTGRKEGAHQPPPERVLGRVHFQGFAQLTAGTNATALKDIWSLPQTLALRDLALDKLAEPIAQSLFPLKSGATTNRTALFRPLLEDLLNAESFLEIVERTNQTPAWTLAVRLKDERTNVWMDSWSKLVPAWPTNEHYQTARMDDSWLVLAHDPKGARNLPLWDDLAAGKQPVVGSFSANTNSAWLNAEMDVPGLANVFSALSNFAALKLAKVHLAVERRGEELRTEGRLEFDSPLNLSLEAWKFPTNTIRDPLLSFTAVRGIAPWLQRQEWVQQMRLSSVPNQAVAWGQARPAYLIQFAVPVENATNEIQRLAAEWVPTLSSNLVDVPLEQIQVTDGFTQIFARSFFLAPFLRRAPETAGEFLNGGIFPILPMSEPPPPELFQQLERTNLVYYHWEITQYRLQSLLETLVHLRSLLVLPPTDTNTLARQWIDAIQDKLGNTVTEATIESPKTFSFVRRSHIGFNGVELLALATWIESTNFPTSGVSVGLQRVPVRMPGKGEVPSPDPVP